MYFVPATHQLMNRVSADAAVADRVISGLGSFPDIVRYSSDTVLRPENITHTGYVVAKFDTRVCMSHENYTKPTHNYKFTSIHKRSKGKVVLVHSMKAYWGVELHSTFLNHGIRWK
jgi:hypothetical protein